MATVEGEILPETRAANELLAGLAQRRGRSAPLGFLCECGDPDCLEPVALDLTEYRALRHVWAPVRGHPAPPALRRS